MNDVNERTVPSTIREAYVQASSFLARQAAAAATSDAGGQEPAFQDPGRAAMMLIRALMGWDQSELILRWNDPFPAGKRDRWQEWLLRKAQGEPVQYIIGEAPFFGRMFRVTPAVLVPRPETELLVERVSLLALEMFGQDRVMTAADIGTGSGAIAVTLSLMHPGWRIIATDVSREALEVARANAQALGAGDRVELVCGDLLEPLIQRGMEADVLVSNPPYIPTAQIAGLMPEVRDHEPRLALDGGADGLDAYRAIARQLPRLPALPRLIGLEVGMGQAHQVAALLAEAARWERVEFVRDLAGIERHVIAIR